MKISIRVKKCQFWIKTYQFLSNQKSDEVFRIRPTRVKKNIFLFIALEKAKYNRQSLIKFKVSFLHIWLVIFFERLHIVALKT